MTKLLKNLRGNKKDNFYSKFKIWKSCIDKELMMAKEWPMTILYQIMLK